MSPVVALPRSDAPTCGERSRTTRRRVRRPAAALALLLAASRIAAADPVPRLDPERLRPIADHAAAAVATRHVPGVVVVAGVGDRVAFTGAWGNKQLRPAPIAMTADTIFDMASCTKVVGTTTAIMLLVDDGRLSVEDPVSRWIPGFTGGGREAVRIRDLLTHTSGVVEYTGSDELVRRSGYGGDPDALLQKICSLPLAYATGRGWRYSCLNMILAARCAEHAAGRSLHEFLTTRVFGPLGMKDTGYRLTADQIRRTAPTGRVVTGSDGYLDAAGALVPPWNGGGPFVKRIVHDHLACFYQNADHCGGNAGLFSSGPDLAIFLRMILNRGSFHGVRVIKPETVDLFTRRQSPAGVTAWCFGWGLLGGFPWTPDPDAPPDRRAIGHSGYTGTYVWIDKSAGLWAAILTNRVHADDSDASKRAVVDLRRKILDTLVKACDAYNP